jgi:hypothetical protein
MQSIGLLFKVLWSPGETMFLLSKNPRVLVPMIFLSVFSLVAGSAVLMKLDFAELTMRMIERSAQGSRMPEEQKAQLRTAMSSPFAKASFFGSTVVVPLITIVFVAAVYFAIFTMVGRDAGFKAFLSITTYAFVPLIFSQIASLVRAYLVPPAFLMLDELGSLSAAVFVDRDSVSPVIFAAANSLDFITIWSLILLVIGYGYVARKSLSKGTRTVTVVSVFLLYVGLKLMSALVRGV